jgi:hypothetical protein
MPPWKNAVPASSSSKQQAASLDSRAPGAKTIDFLVLRSQRVPGAIRSQRVPRAKTIDFFVTQQAAAAAAVAASLDSRPENGPRVMGENAENYGNCNNPRVMGENAEKTQKCRI